ncbi:MAG TPA: T9SS type A sorting domain-containing protein [Ignavibacteria bacterium]
MKNSNIFKIVIFSTLLFFFTDNSFSQMRLKDKYYIGSIGCGLYTEPGVIYFYNPASPNWANWANYNELNFTLNHQYLPDDMPWDHEQPQQGAKKIGAFYDNLVEYFPNLDFIFNTSNGFNIKLILERNKSEFAAYGQRSTYQAEEYYEGNTSVRWIDQRPGYGYSEHQIGSDYYDLTQSPPIWVRRCLVNTDASQHYIVSSLYENCEQVNTENDYRFSDVKSGLNPPYRWYIKPKMRIANWESLDPNTPVVRIEISRYNGSLIQPSITLLIKDFFDSTGNYHGDYTEIFFRNPPAPSTYPLSVSGADLNIGNSNNPKLNFNNCHVDYRVWWYGNVNVYLDYVRVDDEWAHFLFNPGTELQGDRWKFCEKIADPILGEANAFKTNNGFGQFYLDEFQYNNIESIIKTKEIIETATQGQLTIEPVYNYNMLNVRNLNIKNFIRFDDECINSFISKGLFNNFIRFDIYPFVLNPDTWRIKCPHNLIFEDNTGGNIDRNISNLYNDKAVNSEEYNNMIQDKLELFDVVTPGNYVISQMYAFRMSANALLKAREQGKNLVLSYLDQVHAEDFAMKNYEQNHDVFFWREPTNEEISLLSFLGLAYGAKQSIHYDYNVAQYRDTNGYDYHLYGLAKGNGDKRTQNVYKYSDGVHQNKWNGVCSLDVKLKAIGDYLYPPGQPYKHKYYVDTRTVNTYPPIQNQPNYLTITRGLPSNNPAQYISNIQSLGRNPQYHLNWDQADPDSKRHWELGFFENNPNDPDIFREKYSHYFIALNKRCTPETPGNICDGDVRDLRIKFDANSSQLAGFNNWKLIDPATGYTITTFDKNQWTDAGNFQPGEGKLFKLAPVMQEGGMLVCDEAVFSVVVNCKGTVFTNGNSFYIGNDTEIDFNDDCGITAENGGYFECIPISSAILKGYNGAKWSGITINNFSAGVVFDNTEFRDLKYNWALSIINSNPVVLGYNTFNLEDIGVTDVQGAFVINNSMVEEGNSPYAEIEYNHIFTKNTSAAVAVIYSSKAEGTLYLSNNIINSLNNGGSGILLANIHNCPVSNNTISGFDIGINILDCSLGLYNNYIYSSKNGSIGISANALSELYMTNTGDYLSGAINRITNSGTDCYNIKLSNSIFSIDNGRNWFNITGNSNSKNLFGDGNFNIGEGPGNYIEAKNNCFNGPNGTAVYHLVDEQGYNYGLHAEPYNCSREIEIQLDFTVPLANNMQDSVYKRLGNNIQTNSNIILSIKNINLELRKKEFDSAVIKCTELLTNFSDSVFTPDIISKLYLATLNVDSAGFKVQALKTFYEQLIINHQEDTTLIKSANYYVQKCKVYLKQYASALIGFEDIINQNPYAYEGLLASWDYAATLLLMDTTHGAGGMSSKEELNELSSSKDGNDYLIDSLRLKKVVKYDNYDESVFSFSDRTVMFKNSGNILTGERNKQIEKVKDLEKKSKSDNGKEGLRAKRELADLKALNEAVKVKRPTNQTEYVKILNDDIKKVFKNNADNSTIKSNNIIPKEFALYQNYPNPFNPVTKISFDLPKDSKVKLIVYDILGREITRLLNSEFRPAGKHVIEFNAVNLNLASGVYFYRIETDKFIAVKKMLMIK